MIGIKKIIKNSVDIIFIIAWISFSMPLLGWLFGTENDWKTVTFGEFFGNKIWFNFGIISIFYVAIRLLIKGEFWEIIFGNKSDKEILWDILPYLIVIGMLIYLFRR